MKMGGCNLWFRGRGVLLMMLVLIVVGGCEATGEGGGTDAAASLGTLERANADYLGGRYAQAFATASAIERRERRGSAARDQAGYLAGLSAYQLGRFRDAARYLEVLEGSSSGQIAGHASATLGMMDRDADRNANAIGHFKNAYRRLLGKEKAEAAFQCGLTYQKMGQTSAARQQFLLARAASKDPRFRETVEEYVAGTGWTIQLGAFSSLANAEERVREYEEMAVRRSLGAARIYEERKADGGVTLYVVQVGSFMSHELASLSRDRISGPALVTAIGGALGGE